MSRLVLGQLLQPQGGNIRAEQSSWKYLETARHKLGLNELPLPIPVDEWIETAFDIRFGVTDLSRLGRHVLGAAYIKDREILIDQTATQDEGRFRFTCAHELGHFALHSRVAESFRDGELPTGELAGQRERHADRFAAAFLSPLPPLERELVDLCQRGGLDAEYCLSELVMPTAESLWLWKSVFLPALTQRFGISKTAAVLRCRGLRLAADETRSFLPARIREALLGTRSLDVNIEAIRLVNGRPRLDTTSVR